MMGPGPYVGAGGLGLLVSVLSILQLCPLRGARVSPSVPGRAESRLR